MKDKRHEIIEALKKDGKPVLIYGAGKFAGYVAEYVLAHGISVLGFLDALEYYYEGKTKKVGLGQKEKSYKVYCEKDLNENSTFSEWERGVKAYNVLLGRIDYSMLAQVRLQYCKCNIVEYLDGCPSRIMDMQFIEKNRESLREVYDLLSDEESKRVMENYIFARLTGDLDALSALNSRKYLYDYKLLGLQNKDVVVDAGAFDGDTIREMEQYINGKLSFVYAFEPDGITFGTLKKNVGDSEHINCINGGLWKRDGVLSFDNKGNMSSKLSAEKKGNMVEVYSLDQFFQSKKNRMPSVIKMDIEGAELDALVGSEKILTSVMPKLAICVYHKNEDIFMIPLFLKKIAEKINNKKYRFYFRQHSHSATETVCYVIPEDC